MRKIVLVITLTLISISLVDNLSAQRGYTILINDGYIEGENQDQSSDIYGFSHKIYRTYDPVTQRIGGARTVQSVEITKNIDKMTVPLYELILDRPQLDQVDIQVSIFKEVDRCKAQILDKIIAARAFRTSRHGHRTDCDCQAAAINRIRTDGIITVRHNRHGTIVLEGQRVI